VNFYQITQHHNPDDSILTTVVVGGKVFGTLNIVQLTCIYNVTLALPR
jgi:hypothetical protein